MVTEISSKTPAEIDRQITTLLGISPDNRTNVQDATLDALTDEYDRRRWTRAYVVPGGHVHRSPGCHTLRWNTQYWIAVDYSGASEAEIVAAAGERACTSCYPTAPLETRNRPSRIATPDELAALAARQAKAAKQAARAAAAAAQQITDVDGSPLVVDRTRIETLTQARRQLVDCLWWAQTNAKWMKDQPERVERWEANRARHLAEARKVAAAIARKTGEDMDSVLEKADATAKKRR